ncbi:molybdopterin-dependent oxidoreductase [Arthrobacter sp. BPSS-3]|uniref:molybdopterin-dependent oxidoreductase n=1 Tax=Arthrobacter sp. BPSS-3 TaxID=3366580 RepID=UPI0037DDAE84
MNTPQPVAQRPVPPGPEIVGPRVSRWAAASGLAAVGAGVAAGELAAGLLSPSVSPVTAVGGAVIDAVPPGVKEWAISLFGTADKLALLTGMGLAIAVLAAVAGVLELRRRFAGAAVVAVFGLAGLAAVLGRPEADGAAVPAPLLAAAVAVVLLGWLIGALRDWRTTAEETRGTAAPERALEPETPPETLPAALPAPDAGKEPATRRRFLRSFSITAGVAALGGVLAGTLRGATAAVTGYRSTLALPAPASAAPPVPAGADQQLPGQGPLVTPADDFYRIDTALRVPVVDPRTWKLTVTGMVDRPVELDFQALLAKPLIERHITIACVSNEVGGDLIGNARWLGWPVRELLAQAGPQQGADMVLSRSVDGWTAGSPLEALTDNRDAILAIGMNGAPLPLEHGFPVRLVVPGLYGYVSATKWLTELKVTRFAADEGYWTPRGWSERGPIKTSSRIDVPRAGRKVPAGTVTFGGVAWAQHRGIRAVEVRVNRGDWKAAELAPGISADTWRQWRLALPLGPGSYEVQVRATDATGAVQVEAQAPVAPDGATGYHTVTVDVTS